MSELLEVNHVSYAYHSIDGETETLADISFHIKEGEFAAIVGPSGCGKSTLLSLICGLLKPEKGEILLDGKSIAGEKERIGYMLQKDYLFEWRSIYSNVMLGLEIQKKKSEKYTKRVDQMLKDYGLWDFRNVRPSQLSGGMRQRAALIRTLALQPELLLLDEPFAAIDAKIRQELRTWLKDMIEKLGITSIFVTHDQDEAIEVADEIIITNRGHIEQKGSPVEVYQSPETAFSASFFGQAAIVKDYHIFNYFEDVDGADHAIVRPEFIKVTRKNEVQKYKSSASEAVVERVAFRGSYFELGLKVGDVRLSARRGLDEPLVHTGETVDVFVQRIFVIKENKVYTLENSSAKEDYLVI